MAAEVKREGLKAPSPLQQHPPHLSQFSDRSVGQPHGPAVAAFLEQVVCQENDFSNHLHFYYFGGHFPSFVSLFSKTQNLENIKEL